VVQNKFIHTGFWWGYIKERGQSKDLDNNIKIDHKEMRWMVVEWVHLEHGRDKCWAVVDMIMVLRLKQNAGKFFISWSTCPISFLRRTVLSTATILLTQLSDLSP